MELKVEEKSENFYSLEKLLIGDNPYWFYLYSIDYQNEKGNLFIEIGPNTDRGDRRKWLFPEVFNFKEFVEEEDRKDFEFPKMIFGIDLNEGNVAVIACEDVEYSFKISGMPSQVYE